MGTLNFHNLAARAQELLDTVDPDDLDEDTFDGLIEAAAGILPPGVAPNHHHLDTHPAPPLQSRVREDADPWSTHPAESHQSRVREDAYGPTGTEYHSQQVPTGHQQVPEVVIEEVVQQVPTGQQEVTPSESDSTTSHHLKRSKKCAAQNKQTGKPCRAWATSSGYCVFHDPDLTEAVSEMRAKGGRAPKRLLIGEARKLDFQVMDRGGIQALIAQVLRLQLLGALSPRQASQTVKLIGHLVSNAREMMPSEETLESFEHATRALTDATDTIAHRMEWREITDRINAIQDVGSKREEILKANDRFGPRPSYRSARDFGY
jgi:hypothetical protein